MLLVSKGFCLQEQLQRELVFEVLPLPVDWGSQVQFLLGAQLVVVVVILLVWEYLWE